MYSIPVFAIIAVLPAKKVTGIGGFIDAVAETFTVYGSAQGFLLGAMTLGFIGTLLTSGAVWMIGSDRILAVAAYDGAFPGFFGVFNRRFGTPVRVNTMSGIVATIFMVRRGRELQRRARTRSSSWCSTIAISTTLISYLWIFPAAVKLRFSHGHVHRPYRVPGGQRRHARGGDHHDVLGRRWAAGWPSSPARWSRCSGSRTTSRTSGASARAPTRR